MKDLQVIIDLSGSMCEMGKPSVVANVLSTVSGDGPLSKMQWDGSDKTLEPLLEKCSGKNTLLLTDGYALSDNCSTNRNIRNALESENLFVVLCGADALNVSALRDFSRVKTITADNVLFALERFQNTPDNQKAEETGDEW